MDIALEYQVIFALPLPAIDARTPKPTTLVVGGVRDHRRIVHILHDHDAYILWWLLKNACEPAKYVSSQDASQARPKPLLTVWISVLQTASR